MKKVNEIPFPFSGFKNDSHGLEKGQHCLLTDHRPHSATSRNYNCSKQFVFVVKVFIKGEGNKPILTFSDKAEADKCRDALMENYSNYQFRVFEYQVYDKFDLLNPDLSAELDVMLHSYNI